MKNMLPFLNEVKMGVALIMSLLISGCMTTIDRSIGAVDEAKAAYARIEHNPDVAKHSPLESSKASSLLNQAQASLNQGDDTERVEHLAYMSKQFSTLAEERAKLKSTEDAISQASRERDQIRLRARTQEAERARQQALSAERQAALSQQQAAAAQQNLQMSQQQIEQTRRQADEATMRANRLEEQLIELQAKQTERGTVITLEEVLFDTGKAQLKSGARRSLEKLASVLKQNPERNIIIEGFTDSVGGQSYNISLSQKRADAVKEALQELGIDESRMRVRGYGEEYPIASNNNVAGRQLNRRVEIIISDETGRIPSREARKDTSSLTRK